jgi:hypothetical protein
MCGKNSKKVDNIDCKIIEFKIKKRGVFLHPGRERSSKFESSWLQTFTLGKVEAFDIILG